MNPGVTYKRILLILFASILLQAITCIAHSQSLDNFVQDDFQHKITLYDVNGRPIGNEAIETKGSPLLSTKWTLGWILRADGRLLPGLALRLDLEKQMVHYRRADGNDIQVEPGQVKEVAMIDTLSGVDVAYRFICGLAPIGNQSATSFYLLLDSGKASLLESIRKVFKEDKDDLSGEAHKEYTVYNDFYVVSNGKMSRIKKDAKFFLELTNDKRPQMEGYLQETKVSFKSIEDIRQFIHFYNGLP
jgi:hypothetical protein